MYESATFKKVFEPYSINYRDFLNQELIDYPEDTIPNKIRKIRYLSGLSQIEFAKKVGRKEITIAQWERGIFKPNIISQNLIIKMFNLPKDYFD